MTIPGVSYYIALTIYAELGEIGRFDSDKEVVSYVELNRGSASRLTRGSREASRYMDRVGFDGCSSKLLIPQYIPVTTSI